MPQGLQYDVAVLAGDISTPGPKVVQWAQRHSTFQRKPVIVVPGNHEFYGLEIESAIEEMFSAAAGSNVSLLSRGVVEIDGVRFLGCTLWSDFQLPIYDDQAALGTDISAALAAANRRMLDYERIETRVHPSPGMFDRSRRRALRAEDTLARHWIERDWLRRSLRMPFDGSTVVVTHHGPSTGSVPPRYLGDELSPAFASDLTSEMFEVPNLWVHGHTHWATDYRRGSCRVVSNPRGYMMKDGSIENPAFQPGYTVEV